MKLYGLFFNTYDYYEWHDLVAVSDSAEKLEELYKELTKGERDNERLLNGVFRTPAVDNEEAHYNIEEIKVV
jgi:hypothetical protein